MWQQIELDEDAKFGDFSEELVKRAILLRHYPNRIGKWRKEEISEKQLEYLQEHGIDKKTAMRLDRGGASHLIDHIIANDNASRIINHPPTSTTPFVNPWLKTK